MFARVKGLFQGNVEGRLHNADYLVGAAYRGDTVALARLIAEGASVNHANRLGDTALIHAADKGHAEVVRALLDVDGIDVNYSNNAGSTALSLAADKGHVEVVRALLAAGATVNHASDHGYTALSLAADKGHVEVVRALLAAGATVNHASDHGETALMLAAQNGHTEIVTALLAAGATVNHANYHGQAMLFLVVMRGHTGVVRALLAAPGVNVNHANNHGNTALIWAALKGYIEIVTALLATPGVDVNLVSELGPALILAAENGHTEIVTALLAAPDVDVNLANQYGNTALIRAALNGHAEIVTALLAAGATVNLANQNGDTALIFAKKRGHTEIVTVLRVWVTPEQIHGSDMHGVRDALSAANRVYAVKDQVVALALCLNRYSKTYTNMEPKDILLAILRTLHATGYVFENQAVKRRAWGPTVAFVSDSSFMKKACDVRAKAILGGYLSDGVFAGYHGRDVCQSVVACGGGTKMIGALIDDVSDDSTSNLSGKRVGLEKMLAAYPSDEARAELWAKLGELGKTGALVDVVNALLRLQFFDPSPRLKAFVKSYHVPQKICTDTKDDPGHVILLRETQL